jgi:hypothetical protein
MRNPGHAIATLICVLALTTSSSGSAQQMPRLIGHFHPKVGAWAAYDLVREGGPHPGGGQLRVAIVGKDGDAYWIETKITAGPIGDIISKALISGEPHQVRKMFMKSTTGIREMPTFAYRPPPARTELKEAGTESVTVPAGTFKASVLTHDDERASSRSWVKEGIGPWSIVQTTVTGKLDGIVTTLKLRAFGDGAASELDETQALPANDMMMMGGPRGTPPGAPPGTPDVEELRRRALELQKQYQQQQGN